MNAIPTSTDVGATEGRKPAGRLKRGLASLLTVAAVGSAGIALAGPAGAVAGPGATGCSSYGAVFNHRAGGGYWSHSTLNCNRQFWLESIVKVNGNVGDDVGSGWLAGPRTAPVVMNGHELGCVHAAGYQIVDIVWFTNPSGQAYQGGYFTSGAPVAFC